MQDKTSVRVVMAWQDAVNRQDSTRLTELSDPQIAIVGPRGSAYGHQVLREWLERAGVRLVTQRVFARDDVVVVAQHGVWRSAQTDGMPGEADVASVFRVRGQHVVEYARYDTLNEALIQAGLTEADEVRST